MSPEFDKRPFSEWDDETLDRALDALLGGTEPDTFEALEGELGPDELAELEASIAAIQWTHAAGSPREEAPPESLMQSLKAQAEGWIAVQESELDSVPSAPSTPSPRRVEAVEPPVLPGPGSTPWAAIAGWAAAAALLVVLLTRGTESADPVPTSAERFDALVASADDLIRIPWAQTEDPAAASVQGEVIWSKTAQEGYMVFEGLPVNQPTEAQYQLWVFDSERAEWEKLPVDGGVFDIAQDGKTVVPIAAKLPVQSAALFAITIENPGGVVVSKRERLVVTASAG